jgi:Fe-Mn family superoxide dismutase
MRTTAGTRPVTLDRRTLLGATAAAGAWLCLAPRGGLAPVFADADPFVLPPLPYDRTALQPVVSSNTLDYHHGKHHAAYVKNLNDLVKGKPYAAMKLEEVVKASAGKADETAIFNNAAQTWNHTFYWNSMRAGGGGKPTGRMLQKIDASFGDYAKFREAFVKAATGRFGSGWAWLVAAGDKLEIVTTSNADTPLTQEGKKPLLTVDVWEHAYYLDWMNKRKEFVEATLDKLLNWDFADKNLG